MATITIKRSFEFRKSSGNAKTRYKARRAAKQAQERGDKTMERKIDVALSGCSERVAKALIELPRVTQQIESNLAKIERKNHSVWYKDVNPLGNKIHAVQKQRGKSTPLI